MSPVRRALWVGAWVVAGLCVGYTLVLARHGQLGYDSHAYWMAWRGAMYGTPPGQPDAFLYSPAFAQVLWPLAQLPWPVFAAAWAAGLLAALVWLLRPLPLEWQLPLGGAALSEVALGNVHLLLAVVAVVGVARPAVWVVPALTKITPCVGPVWFLVRREWRALAVSLGAIAALVAVSVAVSPQLWAEWVRFLADNATRSTASLGVPLVPPLVVRLPLGLAVLVWGARTTRPWTVPVAVLLASPVLALPSLFVLLGVPRLLGVTGSASPSGRS